MKKIIFILLITTLLFSSTQKVSVQLEWKHQFEYAGFYAAIEHGYYKDIGLHVELKEFHDGLNLSDNVIKGKSEFGISSSSLILDKLNNKHVVLLASYFKQNALVLATNAKISKLSDLKGKKIMALPYELDHTSLGVMLNENGLRKGTYKLVKHDYKIDKLINNEVDAMSIFITNQTYELDKKAFHYNIFNPSDFGIYSYDVELFTSEKFLEENPKLVKSFIEATNKGWEYAFSHKEELVDIIYNKYSKEKSKDALLYEAKSMEKLFKLNIFKIGAIIPELVELNTIIYKKLNLVDKNIDIKKLLSNYIINLKEVSSFKKNKSLLYNKEEKAYIDKNIIVKISNDMKWAPFNYNDFGKANGLAIEYITMILDKAGIKYSFAYGYSWKELLNLFKNEKIDIIPDFYKNKEREKYTLFSSPYYSGELAIYSTSKNLKNKKIGIETSDGSIALITKQFKNSKIVEVDTISMILKKLEENKLDALVCNPLVFNYYANDEQKSKFRIVKYVNLSAKDQREISLHVGVTKNSPTLYSIIQKTIDSLDESEIQKLKNKWILRDKNNNFNFTKEEISYLDKKENITMCIDPSWMPYEKFENGKYVGMTADYFKIFEKKLHIPIKLIPTKTWSQSIEFAKTRKCDILSLAMKTPSRSEYMNFTSPYLRIPLVFATKNDVPFISDIQSIGNKQIGIPKGYAFIEILKERYKNLNILEVKSTKNGLEMVRKGEIFGYIGTLASVGYLFQTNFTGELKIAGKFDDNWELGVAVRNDDQVLLNIFDKLVKDIDEETSRRMLNKWVSIKYEKGTDYSLVYKIIFIALIILLIISFWNRKLNNVNKELKLAKKKAEEATKTKANFLANMSHEIRTPMNSIVSMSYLIRESKLDTMQNKYIQSIQNASNNLLQLLNDILDYSKIEASRLNLNNVDFSLLELLNNVSNIAQVKANEKELNFSISYDKSMNTNLIGDEQRLSQILTNILSNAIKFTKHGKVELVVTQKDNNIFRFDIHDTGIGMEEKQIENIFDSFTQADSGTTRRYGGTGLGLSISKELIILMNGKIWVKSKIDEGSTFSFEIVLQENKDHIAAPQLSNIQKKALSNNSKILSDDMIKNLKEAVSSRRPQLCKPIMDEIEQCNLNEEEEVYFIKIKELIKRYKFNEAKDLLDGK